MKKFVPFCLLLALGGCAAPAALTIAALAVDGLSWMTTGKGTGDHVLSASTNKDCRVTRALQGKAICNNTQVAFATGAGPEEQWPEFGPKTSDVAVASAAPSQAEITAAANTAPAAGMRPGYEPRPTAGVYHGRRGMQDLVYRTTRTRKVQIIQARSVDSRLAGDGGVRFLELEGFAKGAEP